jgi:hypothetical protein
MKKRSYWFLGVLIVLSLFAWTIRAANSTVSRTTWEYKIVIDWNTGEADLNRLGADGWELVQYDPGVRGGNSSANERYFFRRAK